MRSAKAPPVPLSHTITRVNRIQSTSLVYWPTALTRQKLDFVALLQPKDHKRPVPCLIGAANSEKTSLFAPVLQIIPLKRMTHVTKQKAFNKAMIDTDTEIIFLDEAYGSMLDPDK